MPWTYDTATRTATDGSSGIIPRWRLDEAAEILCAAGVTNRRLIVDVLKALTGLGRGEVQFNVELALRDQPPELSYREQWERMYGEFLELPKGPQCQIPKSPL